MNNTGKNNKNAFTLIELMVVITIIFIITFMTYIPYAHHQKKVLLTQATREVAQSFSEARNLAINGLDSGSGNLNIGIFFSSGATQIDYYVSTGSIDRGVLDIYKTKLLPKGTQIDTIDGDAVDRMFVFDAIYGNLNVSPSLSGDDFTIQLSYKGANASVLQSILHYYIKSHISDY